MSEFKIKRFISCYLDPMKTGVDAFAIPWNMKVFTLFQYHRIIPKLELHKTMGIVIISILTT